MASTLATVTLQSETGLAKDNVVNTFAIDQVDSSSAPADLVAVGDALIGFYNTNVAETSKPLCNFLSPVLDTGANRATLRLYQIPAAGGNLGSPYLVRSFTLSSHDATGTALPSEVAFVVTLEAEGRADAAVELGTGSRPKSRHTGRLYIGPLNTTGLTVTGGVARPSNNLMATGRGAALALHAALQAIPAAGLGVWSRTDNVVRELEAVSTDNAFDTQRRRGEAATARTRVAIA